MRLPKPSFWQQAMCRTLPQQNPRRIGEEKRDEQGQKTYPARRWVVERTFAWLSRCRAILVRYDKRADRYLATVKLACALLWFRRWHELDPTLTF